jgi:hypothetical protein
MAPPMTKSPSKITLLVFGVVGLLCFFTGVMKIWSASNASDWPPTEGLVLESKIEEVWDPESTFYVPHIRYEYDVGGNKYVSSRIYFVEKSLDLSGWARDFIDNHPTGSSIQVHYDPVHPWEAALFVGVTPINYGQPLTGLVLIGIACFNLRHFKNGNKNSAQSVAKPVP